MPLRLLMPGDYIVVLLYRGVTVLAAWTAYHAATTTLFCCIYWRVCDAGLNLSFCVHIRLPHHLPRRLSSLPAATATLHTHPATARLARLTLVHYFTTRFCVRCRALVGFDLPAARGCRLFRYSTAYTYSTLPWLPTSGVDRFREILRHSCWVNRAGTLSLVCSSCKSRHAMIPRSNSVVTGRRQAG